MTDSDILRAFESLGDNCEFGLVQSSLGVEQLGFFRFNSVSADALLRVIGNGFADFDNFSGPEIEIACNDELIVHIPDYGFRYHTFYRKGEADIDRLRRQQTRVTQYLARKFREDLCAAEKIFIRKSATASIGEITALHAALRRHGDATLLWVTLAGDGRAGEVEVLEPGLLKGYIDCFSAYKDATAASFAWFEICRAAHALWRGTAVPERHGNEGFANRQYRIAALAEITPAWISQDTPGFATITNAIVHGGHGIVTAGDAAIAETLPEMPPPHSGALIILRDEPAGATIAAAYHLFAGAGEDEESRVQAVHARFQPCIYDQFAKTMAGQASPILLFPDMEGFRVLNALRELAPRHVPRLAIPADRAVQVQRLCLPRSLPD